MKDRQTDIEVAKIMGWSAIQDHPSPKWNPDYPEPHYNGIPPGSDKRQIIPFYSSSMDAAIDAFIWLNLHNPWSPPRNDIALIVTDKGTPALIVCEFMGGGLVAESFLADSFPMAICKAVLSLRDQ